MSMIDRAGAQALMPEQVLRPKGISNRPWSQVSQADYDDAAHLARSSVINLNTGPPSSWTKSNVKLPVLEPSGAVNVNAVHSATSTLLGARGGVEAPAAAKKAAAKRLVALHGHIHADPPASLIRLARS